MDNRKFSYMHLIIIFVVLLWGINTPVVKIGYKYLPPLPFSTVRIVCATVFMWGALLISKSYKKMDKRDIKTILAVGLSGFAVYQLFFTLGMDMVPAGNASLILAMVPISVIIINRLFKIEDITLKSIIGIVFSFIGVALVVVGSGKGLRLSGADLAGIFILLAAQFAFAYYMIFSKPLFEKYSVYQITAYIFTVSAVLFLFFCFKDIRGTNWSKIPFEGWSSLLYSSIVGMCLGNALWSLGVKKVGSAKAAVYLNLQPVFTIIVSCIFLNETFGLIQFAGAIAILAGVYTASMKPTNTKLISLEEVQR